MQAPFNDRFLLYLLGEDDDTSTVPPWCCKMYSSGWMAPTKGDGRKAVCRVPRGGQWRRGYLDSPQIYRSALPLFSSRISMPSMKAAPGAEWAVSGSQPRSGNAGRHIKARLTGGVLPCSLPFDHHHPSVPSPSLRAPSLQYLTLTTPSPTSCAPRFRLGDLTNIPRRHIRH